MFTIVVSSGWANISGEGHCHWFAHNPHDQADKALDLEGGLEEEGELVLTGCLSSDWAYIAPEGHCFDLEKGEAEEFGLLLTASVKKCP